MGRLALAVVCLVGTGGHTWDWCVNVFITFVNLLF